jgi:predicted metalloprotease
MRLDNLPPDDSNIEDRRGGGGGFGFPGGGRRINIPMGGGGRGMGMGTIVMLVIAYFVIKLIFGIDLLDVINGGPGTIPRGNTGGGNSQIEIPAPGGNTSVTDAGGTVNKPNTGNVTGDEGKQFVSRILGSTRSVWTDIFKSMGRQYTAPKLVLFSGFTQSGCGSAQSAMGPFYCPADQQVYIDLSFYQDMKTKLGAPGDFAQAYVVAHEVGHHVQNLLGIADKVQQARMQASETESNALSVRMELQADCLAGVWAEEANKKYNFIEPGDVEEGLNAASAIGDDRLQKRSQGYAVPDTFTHGTSEQRVRWFKTGMQAKDIRDCDTFNTDRI